MRLFFLILAFGLFPSALLAQSATKGTTPQWVDVARMPDIESPEADRLRDHAVDGVFYVMVDTQVLWTGESREDYVRIGLEIVDRAGLERAATIQRSFDPETEAVALTRLDRIRDGVRTSLLGDVEWEVYRRETRLEAGIIDGTLTAVVQVPGLRVGDVVDSATVVTERERFEGAARGVYLSMEYTEPAMLVRHTGLWPAEWSFFSKPTPPQVEYVRVDEGSHIRHQWTRTNNLPDVPEAETPIEVPLRAKVQYGHTDSWREAVGAIGSHYWEEYDLPPAWKALAAEIEAAHESAEERAVAALRLVQDEIRYVSLSVGAGGYLARLPQTVVREGFGDCKDKSLLLVTLLRRLGVDAEVALTDLDEGFDLPNRLPRLAHFDHMIVRARIDGQTYWLDPTMSHQGGSLSQNVRPYVGYALPLTETGPLGLESIEIPRSSAWLSNTRERFLFSLLGVQLRVETRYTGAAADYWRYELATEPVRRIDDRFLRFYGSRYPGIERLVPLETRDHRETNTITLIERYFLPAPALFENRLGEDFFFAAENFARELQNHATPTRSTPLLVGRERVHRHIVQVENAPINFEPPEALRIENEAFLFTFRGTSGEEGDMTLNWLFRTKSRVVDAEEARSIGRHIRDVADNYGYSWDLGYVRPDNP